MVAQLTRRRFGSLLATAAALTAFSTKPSLAQEGRRIRLIWWGNPERDKRTYAVVDLFEEAHDVTVDAEAYSWGDYWAKLATQAAGRSLPDVIQMDYRFIFEYARRGQLALLDSYFGDELQLDDFDQSLLESGKVDGKLYGIAFGGNSVGYAYNKSVLNELKVELPDPIEWTTEDFVAMGHDVKDTLPDGMYFVSNMGREEGMLEIWMRQRGKALYTEDGQLGFDVEDLEEYWSYWLNLQEAGLTPPPDVQTLDSGKIEELMLINRRALFDFLTSNQLVAVQAISVDEFDMTLVPNQAGGQPGQYLKPGAFLSIAETSEDKSTAAELINFFITNPEANDILLIERSVSADASIRERIADKLSPTEQRIIDYLNLTAKHVSPLPPPPPQGAGEIAQALEPAWDAIAFDRTTVEEAAREFYELAAATLERT